MIELIFNIAGLIMILFGILLLILSEIGWSDARLCAQGELRNKGWMRKAEVLYT